MGAPFSEEHPQLARDELLALEAFESVTAARKLTAAWKEDYNHHPSHSSLGYLTLAEFAARCSAPVRVTHSSGTAE